MQKEERPLAEKCGTQWNHWHNNCYKVWNIYTSICKRIR